MSEKKLTFFWITSCILLVITIIILGEAWDAPGVNKLMFIPFLLLLSVSMFYYFFDKSRSEQSVQQQFSKKLLDVREAEKRKIASELHDGLQQDLHAINFEVQKISKTNFTPKEKLHVISNRIISMIDEIRRISAELYPHQLENLGLKKSIIGMTNNLSDLSDVHFTAKIDDEIDSLFKQEISIHIYRIIQELLNNVIIHSYATRAEVKIAVNKVFLYIDVKDNGKGLEYSIKKMDNFRKGLGIRSIRERLKFMKGTLDIKSESNKGTMFKIIIPLNRIYNSDNG